MESVVEWGYEGNWAEPGSGMAMNQDKWRCGIMSERLTRTSAEIMDVKRVVVAVVVVVVSSVLERLAILHAGTSTKLQHKFGYNFSPLLHYGYCNARGSTSTVTTTTTTTTRLTSVIFALMRVRRSPHDATPPLLLVHCHPWP